MDLPARRPTPGTLAFVPTKVYKVASSTVRTLERKISSFLRRRLGLPRSLCSAALCGETNKLQLPISSFDEEFRVSQTREAMLYRDSNDSRVASADIMVRTGRKWKAQEGQEEAESRLRHWTLVGTVALRRAGFGACPQSHYEEAHGQDKRQLVLKEERAGVEEQRSMDEVEGGAGQEGDLGRAMAGRTPGHQVHHHSYV